MPVARREKEARSLDRKERLSFRDCFACNQACGDKSQGEGRTTSLNVISRNARVPIMFVSTNLLLRTVTTQQCRPAGCRSTDISPLS